jgi:hypothetical protein
MRDIENMRALTAIIEHATYMAFEDMEAIESPIGILL